MNAYTYQEFLPSIPLRPFIHRFGLFNSPEEAAAPVREFLPPNFYKVLVFHFFEDRDMYVEITKFKGNLPLGYVQFHGKERILFQYQKEFKMIIAIFKPGQFRHFFPFSSHQFMDNILSFEDYNNKTLLELQYKILESPSNQDRLNLLDSYFLNRLGQISFKKDRIDEMLHAILREDDWKLQITSEKLEVSKRHLRRTFERAVGMSPKQYHKLVRFTKVLTKMHFFDFSSLSELAYSTGYSNPNHFIEHFKVFTGYTPSAYLKQLFPGTAVVLDVGETIFPDLPHHLKK